MEWIAAFAAAYLMGSIPFGLLITRAAGTEDLRGIGSGNIGATNVLRTGHKGLAAATLLLDMFKGVGAIVLASHYWPGTEGLAALAAVVGHCFPVWLRFKGGKGVATTAGVAIGLGPFGLVYAVVWVAMLALTRISSIAGMSAAIVLPIAAYAVGRTELFPWLVVIAALVVFLHRANIARLRNGTEPKVGGKG